MLSDDAFLRAFFSAELASSEFHHRDHQRAIRLFYEQMF